MDILMEKEELRKFADDTINWLLYSKICSKEGDVYSWANPKKPGYRYPEIMGYYIKLLSYLFKNFGDEKYLNKALISADNLSNELLIDGSVGKNGLKYVFDSAICFSGLIALSKVTSLENNHKVALKKTIDFFYNSMKEKKAIFKDGQDITNLNIWSSSYGSLLIKNTIALMEAYEYYKDNKFKTLAESITHELVSQSFRNNHFSVNSKHSFVYTHCHCYATEGLIYLISKGYDEFTPLVFKSSQWLADNQNDDGSLFNWYLRDNVDRDKQGDATAQATRIWLLTDKEKFKDNINKSTLFLKSLQNHDGGLYYNVNSKGIRSEDINTWVTIFTIQAILWQLEKPERGWIV